MPAQQYNWLSDAAQNWIEQQQSLQPRQTLPDFPSAIVTAKPTAKKEKHSGRPLLNED